MSHFIDHLRAAREHIDAALTAALGHASVDSLFGGLDDPLTAPLSPDGVWTPPLLARLAAETRRRNPDGYTAPQAGLDGVSRRVPVTFPKGLILQACLARTDLTDAQRASIASHNATAWFQTAADGGSDLNHRQIDYPLTGGYVTVCATVYDRDLKRLERDLRRWFWLRWQVQVDDDRGGL